MPIPITVPRLGWSMEHGTFVEWLKRNGEWVQRGEMLFVLEAEKGAQEIESLDEGTLSIPADAPQTGDTVKVGQVIGHLLTQNEAPATAAETVLTTVSKQNPASTPRARRAARELGVDWAMVPGTGRGGRIRERDVRAANFSPLSPALRGEGRKKQLATVFPPCAARLPRGCSTAVGRLRLSR